jgi:hypothetical protein
MNGKFDFRDLLGGASGKVSKDEKLADGVRGPDCDGLHWHLTKKVPGMPRLVELLARSIIGTANANQLCAAALLALVVGRIAEIAGRELAEDVRADQLDHLLAELRAMIAHIEQAEF